MSFRSFVLAGAVAIFAGAAAGAVEPATGASIAWQKADVELDVSPTGDDGATGTKLKPLKTVNKALTLAAEDSDRGQNVRVVLGAGVYREELHLAKQKTDKPGIICIEAETPGAAVISGADVWLDGWQRFPVDNEPWKWNAGDPRFNGARIYKHDWLDVWEEAKNPWGRYEIILDPGGQTYRDADHGGQDARTGPVLRRPARGDFLRQLRRQEDLRVAAGRAWSRARP